MHICASLMQDSLTTHLLGACIVSNKGAGIGSRLLHGALDYLAKRVAPPRCLLSRSSRLSPSTSALDLRGRASSRRPRSLWRPPPCALARRLMHIVKRNTINIDDIFMFQSDRLKQLILYCKLSVEIFVNTFIDSNTADDLASCMDSLYNTEKLARELAAKHSYFLLKWRSSSWLPGSIRVMSKPSGQRDDSPRG